MKHTPGPWKYRGDDGVTGPNGRRILVDGVSIPAGGFNAVAMVEAEANARLIAAAPDMLAALEGVVRVADRKTVEFDAARAAIAKATGEDRR